MAKLHFQGTDFFMDASEVDKAILDELRDCGSEGNNLEAVDYFMSICEVSGDIEDCKGYLKGTGGWLSEELNDHQENLKRLVWLAGCDLRENGQIYFSTY